MTLGRLPRMTPKTVEDLRVWSCLDSVGPTRKPEALLRNLPEYAPSIGWIDPYLSADGLLIMAYQSFVIQTDGKVILVDCAVGEDGNFPARPDWHRKKSNWLAHLGQSGVTPEDVDIVFLTHLHMDHTGWLTRRDAGIWQPTFPNAKHLASEVEKAFWTERHDEFDFMSTSIPDSVMPVMDAGLMETVSAGDEIAPGLHVVDLSGHSPGMLGLEYRKGEEILAAFTADLMHHPLQMAFPQCATMFCSEPDRAVSVRRQKLATYAEQETLMFNNHFPGECAGVAKVSGDGYRFLPKS